MTLKFCVLRLVKIQEDLFGLGPPAGCVFLSHLSLFLLFDDVWWDSCLMLFHVFCLFYCSLGCTSRSVRWVWKQFQRAYLISFERHFSRRPNGGLVGEFLQHVLRVLGIKTLWDVYLPILLMVQKSDDHQLRLGESTIIYRVSQVQVVQDFWTINSSVEFQLILMAFLLIQLPRQQDGEDSAVSSVRTGVDKLLFISWGRDSLLHISK